MGSQSQIQLSDFHFQQLQRMGLAALWHVGSSRTRDRTRVPFIGKQIHNHWTTSETLTIYFYFRVDP